MWAYGELQLQPDEFWRLTPREFRLMLEGFRRREDRAWSIAGWLGMLLIAPHTKKKLTVEHLLGRRLDLMPSLPKERT